MIITMSKGDEQCTCDRCGQIIFERHYVLVGRNTKLHYRCLCCCSCTCSLSSSQSCFEKGGNLYCKTCYFKLWSSANCKRCQAAISHSDLVMQTRGSYYHVHCFRCYFCGVLMKKGQRFGIQNQEIYCEHHYFTTISKNDGNNNIGQTFTESISKDEKSPVLSNGLNQSLEGSTLDKSRLGMNISNRQSPLPAKLESTTTDKPHQYLKQSPHLLQSPSIQSHIDQHSALQSRQKSDASSYTGLLKNAFVDADSSVSATRFHESFLDALREDEAAPLSEQNIFSPNSRLPFKTNTLIDLGGQIEHEMSMPLEEVEFPSRTKTTNSERIVEPPGENEPIRSKVTEEDNTQFQRSNSKDDFRLSPAVELVKERTLTRTFSSSTNSEEEEEISQPVLSTKTKKPRSRENKPKRIRTSFKAHQLLAMKEHFDVDKNPDSSKLAQLAQRIDLPKRVLQVWFQNARAKHRKGLSIFSENMEKLLQPQTSEEKSDSSTISSEK